MGRFLGFLVVVLTLALFAVPPAGAAPDPATLAAEMPTPSCAEGPEREGEVIVGTPCADHIVVPPTVTYVDGGPGDDVIEGSLTTAASTAAVTAASGSCEVECHLEVGSQTFEGGPGDDIVYGDRGNDILRGNAGDDRLYGGIGDDRLEGGPGNDWLSGGFGSDTIDGGEGDDFVRGDGTIDHIFDTGGGFDTLSFATGVTPGFGRGKAPPVPGFPKEEEGERGVLVNLGAGGQDADDGIAASGGGVDEVQAGAFERIIGSPFSDWIVGTGASEEIIGGGGADVIQGGGGADVLRGGADGDYLEGGPGSTMYGESGSEPSKDKVDFCTGGGTEIGCGSTTATVVPRATSAVSVGEVAAGSGSVDVYLVGSSGADTVAAAYTGTAVEFALTGGAAFDTSEADAAGCFATAARAVCPLGAPAAPNVPALDSLLLAGMAGDDSIATFGFPPGASVVELGGAGADTLDGGPSEDLLVDGPPSDTSADSLHAGPGDDALLHNGGADLLDGGEGSDLFLSVSICDGETIEGGAPLANDRDNASWAKNGGLGVDARLDLGVVGEVGPNEAPVCASGSFDHLSGIEDLEGSEGSDVLYGDGGDNQLLGHRGEDTYRALGGDDTIFANAGTPDRAIDCGEGEDTAVVDLAAVGDPAPIGCERVREGTANEFETEIEQPIPAPVTAAPPAAAPPTPTPPVKKPKRDRTPPRTKIVKRPAKLVRVAPRHPAVVVFRFAANERSRFECKLDARPYRRCRSPLRAGLRPGAHAFRVFAVDAAGNRDKTPALFRFRVAVAHGHHR
ncbi:MAG TPA: calcium-binding protein [Solirubrobacterales bacterium]|jgi:Ca2+-binding RTX toxin-like protein|nr:calcium-binding protein [Solirubrobacterales bacterium]